MNIVDEIWKDISGYEGCYQVSNLGRVRSCDRYVEFHRGTRLHKGKLLRPRERAGYLAVALSAYGIQKDKSIHVLVAEAFHGKRPQGFEVNHADTDKHNNYASNLEYLTPSENTKHAYSMGRISQLGEKNNQATITDFDVRQIRHHLASGMTVTGVARLLGVTVAVVSGINVGRTWKHIK
jgi:hypothetical protein